MTLGELQKQIADDLNQDDTLVSGGCHAIPEDSLDILNTISRQLTQVGGVAVIVSTPSITRNGFVDEGIPYDTDAVTISVDEIVSINRARPNAITALQAAQRIALVMDGDTFEFRSMRETADDRTGVLTVQLEFAYSGIITNQGA